MGVGAEDGKKNGTPPGGENGIEGVSPRLNNNENNYNNNNNDNNNNNNNNNDNNNDNNKNETRMKLERNKNETRTITTPLGWRQRKEEEKNKKKKTVQNSLGDLKRSHAYSGLISMNSANCHDCLDLVVLSYNAECRCSYDIWVQNKE